MSLPPQPPSDPESSIRPMPNPYAPDGGNHPDAAPAPKPQKKRSRGWLIAIVIAVVLFGLLVFGSCVAGLASLGSTPAPGSKPLEPAAATPTCFKYSQPYCDEPTAEPTPAAGSETEIDKSDVELKVKIKSKQCFGSAGCNVEYKIKANVDRTGWPKDGTLDVTYKVTGDESGPIKDTLTMDLEEGTYEQSGYQSASTRSGGVKLKVAVTELEYSEW